MQTLPLYVLQARRHWSYVSSHIPRKARMRGNSSDRAAYSSFVGILARQSKLLPVKFGRLLRVSLFVHRALTELAGTLEDL